MKKRFHLLKKITFAAGTVLLMAGSARAGIVYSTDFDVTYKGGTGAYVLGGATPDVVAEDWFGSTNNVGINRTDLTLGNINANRYRGVGVWLDTTGWATGLVTVEIDTANFTAGTDSKATFQAYAANGVDASNTVSMDLHGNAASAGTPVATGSATIALLGAEQEITGNGTDVPFTFDFNGTDQYVGLVFANVNSSGTGTGNTVDIDNLTVADLSTQSETWGGYPLHTDGKSVDTGAWLGWIDVGNSPWIYSFQLDTWMYASESEQVSGSSGAWFYFLR